MYVCMYAWVCMSMMKFLVCMHEYVCVYVCMNIDTQGSVYVYICTFVYVCFFECIYLYGYMYECMYVLMYVCMYQHVSTCLFICLRVCINMWCCVITELLITVAVAITMNRVAGLLSCWLLIRAMVPLLHTWWSKEPPRIFRTM